MAIYARSRRGTSPAFWRAHNAAQTILVRSCMPSIKETVRKLPALKHPLEAKLPVGSAGAEKFIAVWG